jgi:hypothetical protein
MEGWTVMECLYFAVVTLTTTGYGDLVPTHDGSKLFTCVFAFCGIAVIMGAIGLIGCASSHSRYLLVRSCCRWHQPWRGGE